MAAPTLAQKKSARLTANATSLTCTFDNAVVTNAGIVVMVASSVNYSGLTISDNKSNTIGAARQQDGYADIWGKLFLYKAVTGGSSFQVTINQSSGLASIWMGEINGWDSASPVEKEGKQWATVTSGDSPYSPLNFGATSVAEQLFLASIFCNTAAARNYGAGTGWTLEDNYANSDSLGSGVVSKSVTATGTYDPEVTMDGSSTNTIFMGLSIKTGSDGVPGGGGAKPFYYYQALQGS